MNPILSSKMQQQQSQTTSQYQSQAKLPTVHSSSNSGLKALDMKQVKTNLAPNHQSYRQIA